MMQPSNIQIIATILFFCAIAHSFLVSKIESYSHRFDTHSMRRKMLHLLGEIEVVFGIWALILFVAMIFFRGLVHYNESHQVIGGAIHYILEQNYGEPTFIFVIMCMSATAPVLQFSERVIIFISKVIPLKGLIPKYMAILIVGPILGSIITEPAAMTVSAMLLLKYFFIRPLSKKLKYATIGALFVNVSIGGTLTHFAAPPVLIVASKYHWDTIFMFTHFGYKALLAIVVSTSLLVLFFRKELTSCAEVKIEEDKVHPPIWLSLLHLFAIGLVVFMSHHPVIILSIFVFFLGLMDITSKYQTHIKLKSALLVAFFLAGLVTLGSMQDWWLKVLLLKFEGLTLYVGTTFLTAIADNAALTYLGSLVNLNDEMKYYLVAGAVSGGGLTVIANAPNPAGYSILRHAFGQNGIDPLYLLFGALFPTLIACFAFLTLPHL